MVEAHYKMAAVVRLTGIPANTLRTWERRYKITQPERSPGGARLYREEDITRLQLVSALLDFGESIGTLADSTTDDLRSRLAVHRRANSDEPEPHRQHARVAVLGQGLAAQVRAAPSMRIELEVVYDGGGYTEFLTDPTDADVVLIKLPVLGKKPVSLFRQLMAASTARLGIVVFDYASASTLWRLSDAGARLVQGPTRVAPLLQIVEDHLTLHQVRQVTRPFPEVSSDDERPERYFSDAQLGWLREARNGIDCECPNHLSALVEQLNAFETYSLECENRNEDDAQLHATLALATAKARSQLELVLQSVIEADNLQLPDL